MIVVDAAFFVLLLDPDPMRHIERGRDRIELLVSKLQAAGTRIMIPAPIIAEVVAGRIDRVPEVLSVFRRSGSFEIQPFDEPIAIETGLLIRRALDGATGDRPAGWRAGMKYDAMVAATALVRNATEVLTDDGDYDRWLRGRNVRVRKIGDLPLPPEPAQGRLL